MYLQLCELAHERFRLFFKNGFCIVNKVHPDGRLEFIDSFKQPDKIGHFDPDLTAKLKRKYPESYDTYQNAGFSEKL